MKLYFKEKRPQDLFQPSGALDDLRRILHDTNDQVERKKEGVNFLEQSVIFEFNRKVFKSKAHVKKRIENSAPQCSVKAELRNLHAKEVDAIGKKIMALQRELRKFDGEDYDRSRKKILELRREGVHQIKALFKKRNMLKPLSTWFRELPYDLHVKPVALEFEIQEPVKPATLEPPNLNGKRIGWIDKDEKLAGMKMLWEMEPGEQCEICSICGAAIEHAIFKFRCGCSAHWQCAYEKHYRESSTRTSRNFHHCKVCMVAVLFDERQYIRDWFLKLKKTEEKLRVEERRKLRLKNKPKLTQERKKRNQKQAGMKNKNAKKQKRS